jgi:hypothetical protein
MRRMLFLDFDGVLHPLDKVELLHPDKWFVWAPLLEDLLRPWPDVQIMVHSSWRNTFTNDELRQLLKSLAPRVVGGTSSLPKALSIEAALNSSRPPVTSHLVLDDDARLATHRGLNVIVCNPKLGISSHETQAELRAWLETSAPR